VLPSKNSVASVVASDAFCLCLCRKCSGPSLPLSLTDESDDLARARSFLSLSLRVQLLPLLRERTAGSSAIDRRPLELPPLPLLLSTASAAAVVRSFHRYHCCCP
ncbi:hypothetical protein BHM03_00057671, partial [Ensete ventricosum]